MSVGTSVHKLYGQKKRVAVLSREGFAQKYKQMRTMLHEE